VATSVHTNTDAAAQGKQVITFAGLSRGRQDGKPCSCECGLYRHWISGFMQVIGPDQLATARADLAAKAGAPGGRAAPTAQEILNHAIAITPKLYDLQSCQHPLRIQEGAHSEEYTACIGDNDRDRCKWNYGDGPGPTAGLSTGIYVRVSHPFKYEVWDSCQGKSVATKQATLSISGDRKPRTISWS
jgi:hypothetical protein